MIEIDEALAIASKHFPHGPEELAKRLGAQIVYGGLDRLDGLRISIPGKMLIRINNTVSRERQHFTLAHELAHAIRGTKHTSSLDAVNMLLSSRPEEKKANELAAEMLLPRGHLLRLVHRLPIDTTRIRRIAKRARVSPIMAAYRLTNLVEDLNMPNAAVVFFGDNRKPSVWSKTLRIASDAAMQLSEKARANPRALYREPQAPGETITAAALRSQNGTALFVQLLPANVAARKTWDEKLKELADRLFADDASFRQSFSGTISQFTQHVTGLVLRNAVAQFNERYADRWSGAAGKRFRSPQGQEYLRMRLADWFDTG